MLVRFILSLFLTLGLLNAARAQQPFERLGVKVEVLTLSNGRYPEFFPNDSLRRIGSVVYNTRLKRITRLLPPDSLVNRPNAEVSSRWFSPDPLAEKFTHISPYAFVDNNPVNNTDPDGRDIIYNSSSAYNKKTGVTTVTVTTNVSMKVLNNSTLNSQAFGERVSAFRSELSSALTGSHSVGKTNYVFQAGKIDVQAAKDMSGVKSSDHLMVVVDDVTGDAALGARAVGQGELDGKVSYIEPDQDASGMVHEFGHNMGLLHNWKTEDPQDNGKGNYMSYENNKSSFSGSQLTKSFLLGGQGRLNQGSNSSRVSNSSSAGRTTQTHPYYKAAEGEKIPKPLP